MPNDEITNNKLHLTILDIAVKKKNPQLVVDITLRLRAELAGMTPHRMTKILQNSVQPTAEETLHIISILNEYLDEDNKLTMDDLFESAPENRKRA